VTTFEKLRRAFAAELGIKEDAITPDTRIASLFGGMSADSLDLVEFSMMLEELVDLDMPDADLEVWQQIFATGTVQDLADYLDRSRDD
jgi:acyl carrier protein